MNAWERRTIEALVSALQRTERNFVLAVEQKPVRDMTETLAENRAALALAEAVVCPPSKLPALELETRLRGGDPPTP